MPTSPPSPPPPPPDSSTGPTALTNFIRTTLSYDTNVMLAAIISLLLVILFVLLLHLYTRWFLLQARHRSRSSVTVPRTLPSRLPRFTVIDTANSDHNSAKLGLPFQLIASIPLFVYKLDSDRELDCAICLSLFEEEEIGRKLVECGHAFHVECIDMWLHSHSTCPICRGAIRQIQSDRTSKTDQVEIEIGDIVDPGRNSARLTNNNAEMQELEGLRVEIVTGDVVNGTSSSTIGVLQSSRSCGSRSGGKVHPSLDVNGGELEG